MYPCSVLSAKRISVVLSPELMFIVWLATECYIGEGNTHKHKSTEGFEDWRSGAKGKAVLP